MGTVFKIDRWGQFLVLHSFLGGTGDGATPMAGLVSDPAGNLYGTTKVGGLENSGTVFRLAPDNSETVIHDFFVTSFDGRTPRATMIIIENSV